MSSSRQPSNNSNNNNLTYQNQLLDYEPEESQYNHLIHYFLVFFHLYFRDSQRYPNQQTCNHPVDDTNQSYVIKSL